MDAVVRPALPEPSDLPGHHVRALGVQVAYRLSEAGRKMSLLSGGDGRGQQKLFVEIPAARLHLVVVDPNGRARLKLQPRFELVDGEVVRREGATTYDVPPTVDDLFKEAARNHELEARFQLERSQSRHRRRDADRERRTQVAEAFLSDASHRAMVHPAPTPKRCFMATSGGRLLFDAATDVGLARDLPQEAYRRFRTDLRVRKEQNLHVRAQQLAQHAQKRRVIADWVAEYGSEDQRGRHSAGLLPAAEVIEALADEAFAPVADIPLYALNGVVVLEAHVRAVTGRANLSILPSELQVVGVDAASASAAQWAAMRQLQARLPDADVTLREHRLSWRQDPAVPARPVYGVLVTRQMGPFTLRREFAAPER